MKSKESLSTKGIAMGLPYSWDAVVNGRVPNLVDFRVVGSRVLEALGNETFVVKSAAIFGSLPRGDFNRRSDIDLLIVVHNGKVPPARALVNNLRVEAWQDYHIPLSAHIVESREAWQGRHPFGRSFEETLKRFDPDWCIGHPMHKCFRFPYDAKIRIEMEQKARTRLNSSRAFRTSFERARASFGELNEWLQRMRVREGRRPLRLHLVLGRWMLWWLHGDLVADGKTDVSRKFLAAPEFRDLHGHYSELVRLDAEYGEVLENATKGKCQEAQYLVRVQRLLRQDFEVSVALLVIACTLMSRRHPSRSGHLPLRQKVA